MARRGKRSRGPTKAKARKILRHGSIKGHKLTAKQKKFFGAMAGGQKRRKK